MTAGTRARAWRIAAASALAVTVPAPAKAQNIIVAHTPGLFVDALLDGDASLGRRIADSAGAIVRRAVRPSALHIRTSRDAVNANEADVPRPLPWPLDDIRELGKQLGADVVINVAATGSRSGVRVMLTRIERGKPPAPLSPIEAPTIAAASRTVAGILLRPSVVPQWSIGSPCPRSLFREDQVDQRARFLSAEGAAFKPVARTAGSDDQLIFDVDTTGRIIPTSLRLEYASDTSLLHAARNDVVRWRFAPAIAGTCRVMSVVRMWVGS